MAKNIEDAFIQINEDSKGKKVFVIICGSLYLMRDIALNLK
jgi:folylpolyglutamate synthase/dihydropteroate synthase